MHLPSSAISIILSISPILSETCPATKAPRAEYAAPMGFAYDARQVRHIHITNIKAIPRRQAAYGLAEPRALLRYVLLCDTHELHRRYPRPSNP